MADKHAAFSVLGLEMEFMLVNRDTLNIEPKSDALIRALAGQIRNEVLLDDITLSNELVLHVIELKTQNPHLPEYAMSRFFQKALNQLQPLLDSMQLCLLPTGAHPWMNPLEETRRWLHHDVEIYEQYNTIFNCEGHGWANLQSMHVNLPFENDAEFFKLHSAIRLLLPLLPALSASTPILDGKNTGIKDARLYYYGHNQQKIPAIHGDIIPEFIDSQAAYEREILRPMYAAIHPFDTDKILQHEWLNSRAAIPKFSRHSLEIRIVDTQECIDTHMAIALCIHTLLKNWCKTPEYFLEHPCSSKTLRTLYETSIHQGLQAEVHDRELYHQWQISPGKTQNLAAVWENLLEKFGGDLDAKSQLILEKILSQGNLSDRILRACAGNFHKKHLTAIYKKLASCLLENQFFETL